MGALIQLVTLGTLYIGQMRVYSILFAAGIWSDIAAQNLVLDPAFGEDGVALVSFGNANDRPRDIDVLPDGRIVLCGWVDATVTSMGAAALSAAGVLDTSLNGTGTVTINPNAFNTDCIVDAMVVQPSDNRIVLAGMVVIRLTATGDLDSTFGYNGVVHRSASDVVIQDDGRIVCSNAWGLEDDLTVFRLLPNGQLDSTFGMNGIARAGVSDIDGWTSLCLYGDGRILAAGRRQQDGVYLIARWDANGSIDENFGVEGVVESGSNSSGVSFPIILLRADGSIFLASDTGTTTGTGWTVRGYLGDGLVDESFGVNGIATIGFDGMGGLNGVTLDGQGRILLIGYVNSPGEISTVVARLLPNGQLDQSFAGAGSFVFPSSIGEAAEVQPDGRIVICGRKAGNMFVIRLTEEIATGTLSGDWGEQPSPASVVRVNGSLAIATYGLWEVRKQVVVLDAMGRLLAKHEMTSTESMVALPGSVQGLLIVRVSDGYRSFTTRLIVE